MLGGRGADKAMVWKCHHLQMMEERDLGGRSMNTFLYAAIWQRDTKLRAGRHEDLVSSY